MNATTLQNGQPLKDPDQAKARLKELVTRLEDQLDKLIKMYAFSREALENEMLSGMGYKGQGLHEAFPKKLKELTIGLNSLVETKIKWDKAKKALGETLTKEEEIEAAFQFIMSLTHAEQGQLRDRLSNHGIYKWKS